MPPGESNYSILYHLIIKPHDLSLPLVLRHPRQEYKLTIFLGGIINQRGGESTQEAKVVADGRRDRQQASLVLWGLCGLTVRGRMRLPAAPFGCHQEFPVREGMLLQGV